jgi:hypothetical protein
MAARTCMGYNIHITRRKEWSDDGDDISLGEWLDVVRHDPELSLVDATDYDVVWTSPDGFQEWLLFSDGRIFKKRPAQEVFARTIDKIVQIAT